MKAIILLIVTLLSLNGYAQSAADHFAEGKKLYETKKYTEAISKFIAAEKAGFKDAELFILKGNSQVRLEDDKGALKATAMQLLQTRNRPGLFIIAELYTKTLVNTTKL